MYDEKRIAYILDTFTYNKNKVFAISALFLSMPFTYVICRHSSSLLDIIVTLFIFYINSIILLNYLFSHLRKKLWEASPRLIDLQRALTETGTNIIYHSSCNGVINYVLVEPYEDEQYNDAGFPLFLMSIEDKSRAVVAISYNIVKEGSNQFGTVYQVFRSTKGLCFAHMNGVGNNGVYIDITMATKLMACLRKNLPDYESGLGTTSFNIKTSVILPK